MKFLLKLLHVVIGVILFIGLATAINTLLDSSQADLVTKNTSESISTSSVNSSSEDLQTVSTSPVVESSVDDLAPSEEEMSVPDISTVPEETTIPEIDPIQQLSYEMTPLKKHSIEHLHKMLEHLSDYSLEPHDDLQELYRLVYNKNYMHIEEELSTKNTAVKDMLSNLISSISNIEPEADYNNVVQLIDDIVTITNQLIEVE